jgi:hypothetical protein
MLEKSSINPKINVYLRPWYTLKKADKKNYEVYFSSNPILKNEIKK